MGKSHDLETVWIMGEYESTWIGFNVVLASLKNNPMFHNIMVIEPIVS